jgi:hypothetical protein
MDVLLSGTQVVFGSAESTTIRCSRPKELLFLGHLACKWQGRIVSYADGFVILCASRRQAEAGLSLVSHWLAKLGLAIHPTKTRLCWAREEPFEFLGYIFGLAEYWQIGKRFISARPLKKAQKRLKAT